MIFAGFVVAAAVVGASAQDLTRLSQSCQNAAAAVLVGPAATCLGVSGLVNVAMTPADQSFITPINNWLTSTCAQPACTNATLDAAISNITTGCSTDLSGAGVTSGTIEDITEYIKEYYPIGREVACLQDTSANNAFCITTTLQAIENYIGAPLSLNTISTVAPRLAATGTEVPKSLTCTNCVQAAYALIRPRIDESARGSWDNYLGSQCGSSYTNGTSPATIRQSANTATAGSSNSAVSLSSGVLSSTVTLLVGVAGLAVFAL